MARTGALILDFDGVVVDSEQAIQPGADLGHDWRIGSRELEARVHCLSTVPEQPDCGIVR